MNSEKRARVRCTTDEQRWLAYVMPTGFCWEWVGARTRSGYGQVCRPGRAVVYAHRWAYEYLVGPIPDGMELDHLCRNPLCVNPDHLETVTHAENTRRSRNPAGLNARKTVCPRGHPLVPHPRRKERYCPVCLRKQDKMRMRRIRAERRAA